MSMPRKGPTAFKDLTGKRFGRQVVLGGSSKRWLVKCDCGSPAHVIAQPACVQSCGCLQREAAAIVGRNHVPKPPDPLRQTSECHIWGGMRDRCNRQANKRWANYGGRGIKVCARWDRFENFLADMGPRPSSKHSLDRINNDGDYEPSNCRWATPQEQRNNSRHNHRVVHNGRVMTLADYARLVGVPLRNARTAFKSGKLRAAS